MPNVALHSSQVPHRFHRIGPMWMAQCVDSVKQNGRFTDNHLGRSTGMIVGGYSAMVVAPSL
ncbi:MAG: hypothetical protein EPN57_15515 [Paraburkholderia sp.]|nr:MAG: hypothetical protein EPN57_15515 [Paraburkholderia sp.]